MELSAAVQRLLEASAALFILPFLVIGGIWLYNSLVPWKKRTKTSTVALTLTLLLFLVGSMWALRCAVGRFALAFPADVDAPQLTQKQTYFQGLLRALRTIGLEEEYGAYVSELRRMFDTLFHGRTILARCFVIGTSAQYLLAPVLGGAVVLEALASVLPRLKLCLAQLLVWRKKYYFSKLTPSSLALAKSLCAESKTLWTQPIVVFGDVYVDKEQESSMELLLEARRFGAICLRDDLAHVWKNRVGRRSFFLIDDNEFVNLQTLVDLAERRHFKYLRRAEIHLFVQSEAYVEIEKKVRAKMAKYDKGRGELPLIVPVNSYRNLVNNLLTQVPLYEPLIRKEKEKDSLRVTILGNGIIGTEALLSTYWFGQMLVQNEGELTGCRVSVNVVSAEEKTDFYDKLDYINPEICRSTDAADELLQWGDEDERNDPYCTIHYKRADVKNGKLWSNESEEREHLLASDYFIVALGNDADNIAVAEKLRRYVGQQQLEGKRQSDAVIAYAVFDTELCETLNTREPQAQGAAPWGAYMYAFGSLEQVYSRENVLMSCWTVWANETEKAYVYSRSKSNYVRENEERAKSADRNYNHWANLARAMHVKYKVFSLGWFKESIFTHMGSADEEAAYRDAVRELCAQYRRLAVIREEERLTEEDKVRRTQLTASAECLAWLEHRRWCAFTRTMGYQCTAALAENLRQNGNHKHMPLKLHPCLVEARRPSYRLKETFKADGCRDRLDAVTRQWSETVASALATKDALLAEKARDAAVYDFKKYDYYDSEFDKHEWLEKLVAREVPGLSRRRLLRLCRAKKVEGAFLYGTEATADWNLSEEALKNYLPRAYKAMEKAADVALCEEPSRVKGAFKMGYTWYAKPRHLKAARNETAKKE